MKVLELRRHAAREKEADALTPEGRVQAEDLGRSLTHRFDVVFVSPARRAAETAAWILRGAGHPVPDHAVVQGLVSDQEDRWRAAGKASHSSRLDALVLHEPGFIGDEVKRLTAVIEGLIDRVPEGGRGLAVGHSPLLEAAVYGLTGAVIEPLKECEGVALIRSDEEHPTFRLEELRRSRSVQT